MSASPSTSQLTGSFGGASFRLDELEERGAELSATSVVTSLPPTPRKKEDTARRHKRFSLPAVALQATPVMARPSLVGEGKTKRFSLVLGKSSSTGGGVGNGVSDLGSSIMHSAAAGKLSELLGRSTKHSER